MRPILEHEALLEHAVDGAGAPATGAGTAKDTSRFRDMRIEWVLAGAWSLSIEGTIDGSTWTSIAGPLTAGNGIVEVAKFWRKIRVNATVVGTAGQFSVVIGGWTVGDWE